MRRIIPVLLFLPALILMTGLACGGSTSSEEESRTQLGITPPRDAGPESSTETSNYLAVMGSAMTAIGDSLRNLSELTGDPKIGDTDWTIDVAVEVTRIRGAHEQMLELEPPAELAALHFAALDAAGDCKTGMDRFVEGIDNRDAASLQVAAQMIATCGAKSQKATVLLDQYLKGQGIQGTLEETPDQSPPSQSSATVNKGANLRAGPGTSYAVVAGANQGDTIELVARNEAGDWYQLASGSWIASFLVDNAPSDLPVASDIPEPGN